MGNACVGAVANDILLANGLHGVAVFAFVGAWLVGNAPKVARLLDCDHRWFNHRLPHHWGCDGARRAALHVATANQHKAVHPEIAGRNPDVGLGSVSVYGVLAD